MIVHSSQFFSRRRRLLAATILALAAAPGLALADDQSGDTGKPVEEITVLQKRLMVKDDDIASAATELTKTDVEAANPTTGSLETLLKMTPSVNAYTFGTGQNMPTLSVRGESEQVLSLTVDGIPMNGLFGGGGGQGSYLSGFGGAVVLSQVEGATVYAGVAPPDKQGFGTAGGTLAYTTKHATDDEYADVNFGAGSFSAIHYGFDYNTGKLFGDDPDAVKAYIAYDQSWTDGFVENTPSRYKNFMVNVVKPYDDGTGKVELTIINNWAYGYTQDSPTPVPLQQQTGNLFYNKPYSDGFYRQSNDYLTVIAHDVTPITDELIFDASAFFQQQTSTVNSFESQADLGSTYPANIQVPAFFYPCGDAGRTGLASTYQTTAGASCNNLATYTTTRTFGFTPKASYFLDTDWAHQEISVGGLVGQSKITTATFAGGDDVGIPGPNTSWAAQGITYGGFQQRTVISGYMQDKIDLFNDTLHLLPGVREEAAYSSAHEIASGGFYTPSIVDNWTHETEPYYGVSYDVVDHVTAYGNYGRGSLFAPISNYQTGTNGITNAPRPEEITLWEGGLKYNDENLFLGADYYYQKVRKAFSFFANFITGETDYGNQGRQQFRGVETSGKYKLPSSILPGISIFGNASFNEATYLATSPAFVTLTGDQYGQAFRGTPVSNVPEYLGNVGVEYDNNGLLLRATVQYTGSEFITQDLTTGPACATATYNANLCGITYTDLTQKNPSSTIVNLLAEYTVPVEYDRLKNIKLTLNIQNLFDKHYYNYYYSAENPSPGGLYGVEPEFNNGLVAQPRSIMGDISLHF